jgi:GDP-mannose 6-dehydrogenase
MGVDTEAAIETYKADARLNASAAYHNPGVAFGGSCLPKDLRASSHRAKDLDPRFPLFESILLSNLMHIERALESIVRSRKKNLGVLGLSFNSGTDDLSESPIVQLIKSLIGEGFQTKVWDPDDSLGNSLNQIVGALKTTSRTSTPYWWVIGSR